MSIDIVAELARIAAAVSPWVSVDEMCARYQVCSKTLLAMERRGEIPRRTNGRWYRPTLIEFERARAAESA